MKILTIVFVLMMVLPCAYAAEDNESASFEGITGGLFDDINSFLYSLVFALVALFALYCIVAIIIGWFSHNERLFMRGVKGCGAIILAAAVYFIALNGFNYIVDTYWNK